MTLLVSALLLFGTLNAAHAMNQYGAPGSQVVRTVHDTVPLPLADSALRNDSRIFTKLEIEPSYQGGDSAWQRLVDSTLDANKRILHRDRENSKGTCEIQMIISNVGRVSDVRAVNMQNSVLATVLIQMIKANPNWNPGRQNGHVVNAFRRVKVVY